MMKKLVVLFIAVAALFAFSACEPYAVTLDETGSVELDDVGIRNYNLSGKTLVNKDYEYIYKTVRTIMEVTTGGTTKTTTSRETVKIPCSVKTDTITFAADGTYTSTEVVTYLAGADGDYRQTTVSSNPAAGTTVTTTTYYYSEDSLEDAVIAGRAGLTTYTSSAAGTWERITRQQDALDSITWEYYTLTTSSSNSSTSLDSDWTTDAAVIEGAPGNTNKVTYSAGDTTNYVNATSDEPYSLGNVYWVRDDADGNDVVYIDEDLYTVQP